jgi:GT2 family glycosyltransferase
MDDDVVPEPDCLELLVNDFDKNTVRAPLRFTPDKIPFYNDALTYNLSNPLRNIWNDIAGEKEFKSKYFHAVGITFEGPIMHRSLVEKIGFPEKKFFIYGDDTEYFIRASKAGADIVVVCDARLNRKLAAAPHERFNWKHYYFVRNIIAIDVLHGNIPVRFVRPFGYLIKWLMRCRNASQLKTTLKAFVDGYFYKSDN